MAADLPFIGFAQVSRVRADSLVGKDPNRPRSIGGHQIEEVQERLRLHLPGPEGQWSWILHRITGVAVILFLFAHVVDTAVVGWGPEAYNRVTAAYENPFVRLLELGLVVAVLYHSLNGLKITLIDFFPGS